MQQASPLSPAVAQTLQTTLQDALDLAVVKGLDTAFDLELFSLQRQVEEVVRSGCEASARRTLSRCRAMRSTLSAAPARTSRAFLPKLRRAPGRH